MLLKRAILYRKHDLKILTAAHCMLYRTLTLQNTLLYVVLLTAHFFQNWKRLFLSCYSHEIDRVQAVDRDLKKKNYTLKITIFLWICKIRGNFLENERNRYFANYCLMKARIWEFFCTHVAHVIVVNLLHSKFRFY